MPWIENELDHHHAVFISAGLGWVLRQRYESGPYSQIEVMPDNVFTEMLKQLRHRSQKEDEQSRHLALQTFAEARPHVERQLGLLQDRKDILSADDYIRELAIVAADLWELGARRSAWIVLSGDFERSFATLALTLRLRTGCQLLQMLIDDDEPEMARSWVQRFEKDLETLPPADSQKPVGLGLVARWYRSMCGYNEAIAAYTEAILYTTDPTERQRLASEVCEMHYLQGELDRTFEDTVPISDPLGTRSEVRRILIRARTLALTGDSAKALDLLDISLQHTASAIDQVDLYMARAEIFHLDCKDSECFEIFTTHIDPLLAEIDSESALVVGFNRADISTHAFQPNNFYNW